MGKRQTKASTVLLLSTAGLLASYPFHGTFAGGILTAGFAAATVGGLADWFAVEALFRKPLGIPFRTAVISRNRQRIFQLLAETVQQELLLTENIRRHLADYDAIAALLRLLDEPASHRMLRGLLYRSVRDLLRPEHGAVIARQGEALLQELVGRWSVGPRLLEWLQQLAETGRDERLISWLLDKAQRWSQSPVLTEALARWAKTTLERYGQGGSLRELAVSFADLDPQVLARWAQDELAALLGELRKPEHRWRQLWRAKRLAWLRDKENDSELLLLLERWKEQFIAEAAVADQLQGALGERRQAVWLTRRLYAWIRQYQENLRNDQAARLRLNTQGKELVLHWLERNQEEIGRTVLANLQRFSEQDLVEMIESRAGDDLQMIRINGAVVGGITGALLYLLERAL